MSNDQLGDFTAPLLALATLIVGMANLLFPQPRTPRPSSVASSAKLIDLVSMIHTKAKALEGSSGMRLGLRAFTTAHNIPPDRVSYSDYVSVRLLFEATRDAGFWNLHWSITNMPPNSDNVWRQWRNVTRPSLLAPTATAECDELSALFAFLVERAGVRGVGLFWPYANHTLPPQRTKISAPSGL